MLVSDYMWGLNKKVTVSETTQLVVVTRFAHK